MKQNIYFFHNQPKTSIVAINLFSIFILLYEGQLWELVKYQ